MIVEVTAPARAKFTPADALKHIQAIPENDGNSSGQLLIEAVNLAKVAAATSEELTMIIISESNQERASKPVKTPRLRHRAHRCPWRCRPQAEALETKASYWTPISLTSLCCIR